MKGFFKVAKALIIIAMVLIVIFNGYNLVNTKILGKDLTILNDRAILEVVSGSMEPALKIGDLIVIKTNDYNYKPGDIVTFRDDNGSFITHRIVTINGNEAITKGDANNTVDKPILLDKIVGKYRYRIAYLGNVLRAFKNTSTLIIFLVMGTIVCFILSLKDEEEKEQIEQAKKEKEFLEKMYTQPIRTVNIDNNRKSTAKKIKEADKKRQVITNSAKKSNASKTISKATRSASKTTTSVVAKPTVKKATKKVETKPVVKKSTKKVETKPVVKKPTKNAIKTVVKKGSIKTNNKKINK